MGQNSLNLVILPKPKLLPKKKKTMGDDFMKQWKSFRQIYRIKIDQTTNWTLQWKVNNFLSLAINISPQNYDGNTAEISTHKIQP
jgi:hypothetical protein